MQQALLLPPAIGESRWHGITASLVNSDLWTARQPTIQLVLLFCSLYFIHILLCPDCPGFAFCPLLYNTHIHVPGRIFFVCILLYPVFQPYFIFNVLHFCLFIFTNNTQTQTPMPPAGFEPATPASDRPQTLALDRSPTGIGKMSVPHAICDADAVLPLPFSCASEYALWKSK